MAKLRVDLKLGHSQGRGVGYYANNLAKALEETGEVVITDKDPDLIHYPFFDLFYSTLPLFKQKPTIVTIHDLTPLVLKNLYPQGIRAKVNLLRQRLSLTNISAIITDSENSKSDIRRYFGIQKEKINAIPLAVDPIYARKPFAAYINQVRRKYNLPNDFVLYVGGINANKNLLRLAEACTDLDIPLVLVGSEFTKVPRETFSFKRMLGIQKIHPELANFQQLIEYIDNHEGIRVLGFIESKELSAVYRLATLYCQPSLYEGFGLPLLEAMTAGCLIISSNAGSLPEIYPEGTITFDPNEVNSIKEALSNALKLKAADLRKLISAQNIKAKEFSWQKTASLTLSIYRQVLRARV